jgi:hypothetical protein
LPTVQKLKSIVEVAATNGTTVGGIAHNIERIPQVLSSCMPKLSDHSPLEQYGLFALVYVLSLQSYYVSPSAELCPLKPRLTLTCLLRKVEVVSSLSR